MTLAGSGFWRESADSVIETTPSRCRPLERLDDFRDFGAHAVRTAGLCATVLNHGANPLRGRFLNQPFRSRRSR